MSEPGCAICRRPQVEAYRPFCSRRCADVDLQRWLVGSYAIPSEEGDEGDAEAPRGIVEDDE